MVNKHGLIEEDIRGGTLYAPNGQEIMGTLEVIHGRAGIMPGTVIKKDDGTFDFDYDGDTEVFWDEQLTKTEEGQRIFLDEEGNEWYEKDLILNEEVP